MVGLVFILSLVAASKILELSLGKSFGQTFHDFSGNDRTAVNGQSSSTTTDDTIGTDRGAYFSGGYTQISLPPNNKVVDYFNLPSACSIIFWAMIQDLDSHIFMH